MPNTLFEHFNVKNHILLLKEGNEVFHLGQATKEIYRVITGQVQLFRDDFNGNRIILHQAFSGQFFAEASINSSHYHCTAKCMQATELEVINIEQFQAELKNNAAFSEAWINHLSTELRRQRSNVERLSLNTAVEKITHLILTEGDEHGVFILNSSLTEIAQRLGLSRESLYRTLSKMKKNRQIEQSLESLNLLN